jgi:ribosomal protein L37AE/L43A
LVRDGINGLIKESPIPLFEDLGRSLGWKGAARFLHMTLDPRVRSEPLGLISFRFDSIRCRKNGCLKRVRDEGSQCGACGSVFEEDAILSAPWDAGDEDSRSRDIDEVEFRKIMCHNCQDPAFNSVSKKGSWLCSSCIQYSGRAGTVTIKRLINCEELVKDVLGL